MQCYKVLIEELYNLVIGDSTAVLYDDLDHDWKFSVKSTDILQKFVCGDFTFFATDCALM